MDKTTMLLSNLIIIIIICIFGYILNLNAIGVGVGILGAMAVFNITYWLWNRKK